MVKIKNAFFIMVKEVFKDLMLIVCVIAPILLGFFLKSLYHM